MLANKSRVIVPYKVDTGGDSNKMPLHIYTTLFSRVTSEQLVPT